MGFIDIVLLAIIILVGFKGFYDGFIHEVSALIGVVAGIFFASRLALPMGAFFNEHIYNINSPSLTIILGFVIVLAFFWIGFLMIGFVLSRFVKFSGLGLLDRILGYIFSCVKVFCIFSFLFFALNEIKFIREIDFVKKLPANSKIYAAMMDTSEVLVRFANSQEIDKRLQNFNKIGEQATEFIQSPKAKEVVKVTKDGIKDMKDGIKDMKEKVNP